MIRHLRVVSDGSVAGCLATTEAKELGQEQIL